MPRWLGRFGFSFLVIAFFLAWQGYRGASGELSNLPGWEIILFFVGATISFVLGFVGVRERHRTR